MSEGFLTNHKCGLEAGTSTSSTSSASSTTINEVEDAQAPVPPPNVIRTLSGRVVKTRVVPKCGPPEGDKSGDGKRLKRQLTIKKTPGSNKRAKVFRQNPPQPACAPSIRVVKSETADCQGTTFNVGDIVSLIDLEDEKKYFAQIRCLLTDQFAHKSAVVTWLIPTRLTKNVHEFDAKTFIIGHEEVFPRPLTCLQFECGCPKSLENPRKAQSVQRRVKDESYEIARLLTVERYFSNFEKKLR